jgi:DNA-binding NarL/FixJ family response regulator
MKAVVRVLIADDHPLYRRALSELFQRERGFTLLGAVADLPAALELVRHDGCDLAILDVRMPGMDDLAGVEKIRQCCPDGKIALISGHIDAPIVAAGRRAGVVGFLPKSFDHDVILAAVKLILAGGIYVPYDLSPGDAHISPPPAAGGSPPLSPREREILTLMARGATHKEIGRALGLAEVTVKLHTQRIVRKLAVKNRSAAIAKAVRDGLIEPT